jgi:hypothetical protein
LRFRFRHVEFSQHGSATSHQCGDQNPGALGSSPPAGVGRPGDKAPLVEDGRTWRRLWNETNWRKENMGISWDSTEKKGLYFSLIQYPLFQYYPIIIPAFHGILPEIKTDFWFLNLQDMRI